MYEHIMARLVDVKILGQTNICQTYMTEVLVHTHVLPLAVNIIYLG